MRCFALCVIFLFFFIILFFVLFIVLCGEMFIFLSLSVVDVYFYVFFPNRRVRMDCWFSLLFVYMENV